MSLFKIDKSYFDSFKVLAKPKAFFASSSSGVTGSIRVFPAASIVAKEVVKSSFEDIPDEQTPEQIREQAIKDGINQDSLEKYLDSVNKETSNSRLEKELEVIRFEPSLRFTSDSVRKSVIKNVLYPFYRTKYTRSCNWAFTNYNTLNFFSTSDDTIPNDAVLIYPASGSQTYRPPKAFSFEFYINPRYSAHAVGDEFHAGTILHMSSSYALSLVSGSSVDHNGEINGYRLLLQLTHSAEVSPSECPLDLSGTPSPPYDFVFSSSDNSLTKNHWHHCCVRWDNNTQNSTGSFVIDGEVMGTFEIPESAIVDDVFQKDLPGLVDRGGTDYNLGNPDALFVGNFYEGPNSDGPTTQDFISQFFNPDAAYSDGLQNFYPTLSPGSPSNPTEPDIYSFSHPLNAEIHELKIYDIYRVDSDIAASRYNGFSSMQQEKNNGLLFYVPPFFVKETLERDILQTPFQTARGSTDDPFSVPLSFGLGGHYLNLENFTKEFVENSFPRLLNLSASTIDATTDWVSANEFLFATGSVRKRNLTVLPNDNGIFIPSFSILEETAESDSSLSLYIDSMGNKNLSIVSLENLIPTGSIGEGLLGAETQGSLSEALQGPTPEDPSIPQGSILTVYNRTRDPSSNEISIFDASNLFYGNKIDPGTYILSDNSVTGSAGRVSISLQDSTGSLYRADCLTPHAKWSSVGSVLYEEGIATVHTPLIPRFGADDFSVQMVGQQNIHVLRLDIPVERGSLDISSNPTYRSLAPSDQNADTETNFTYITNLNLLDENLNIISKTNFSQALIKRENDRYVIRVKLDF
jgi:hypothetical protein